MLGLLDSSLLAFILRTCLWCSWLCSKAVKCWSRRTLGHVWIQCLRSILFWRRIRFLPMKSQKLL